MFAVAFTACSVVAATAAFATFAALRAPVTFTALASFTVFA